MLVFTELAQSQVGRTGTCGINLFVRHYFYDLFVDGKHLFGGSGPELCVNDLSSNALCSIVRLPFFRTTFSKTSSFEPASSRAKNHTAGEGRRMLVFTERAQSQVGRTGNSEKQKK